MRRIAVYERVGFKFGAWHDVAWYGMRLNDPEGIPPEPIVLPGARSGLTLTSRHMPARHQGASDKT